MSFSESCLLENARCSDRIVTALLRLTHYLDTKIHLSELLNVIASNHYDFFVVL